MTILTPDFDMAGPVLSDMRGDAAERSAGAGIGISSDEGLAGDARLYLRHVEGGESIRAIAREAGCHASTILRRIRRFENRRDDPLVDEALHDLGHAELPARRDRQSEDQTRRVLRRLAEPGAELVVAPDLPKAIVTRGEVRTAVFDRQLAEGFALRGWVEAAGKGGRMLRYRITGAGRAALRRLGRGEGGLPRAGDFADARPVDAPVAGMAEGPAAFDHGGAGQGGSDQGGSDHGDRHRIWGSRTLPDPEGGAPKRMRVNLGESPLLLLARRRDTRGKPFLSPELVGAGERLREDFELARMGPRVTQNWDRFLTAGTGQSMRADRHSGGSDAARARVAEALRELGPGMGDLVLRVCCFLEGLEMTERGLGWSARSGKVVLKLALERLARHYEVRYGPGGPLIG